MGRNCSKNGCIGCIYCFCECNFACIKCNVSRTSSCEDIKNKPERKLVENFRERWICIDCRYMWSSKYTKWLEIRDTDLNKKVKKIQNKNKIGICHKCKKESIKVGQKFRMPPKNRNKIKVNKFWKNLKKRYDETGYTHEIDDYCPNDRYLHSNKKHKENKQVIDKDQYTHQRIRRFGGMYIDDIDVLSLDQGRRWMEYEDENNINLLRKHGKKHKLIINEYNRTRDRYSTRYIPKKFDRNEYIKYLGF